MDTRCYAGSTSPRRTSSSRAGSGGCRCSLCHRHPARPSARSQGLLPRGGRGLDTKQGKQLRRAQRIVGLQFRIGNTQTGPCRALPFTLVLQHNPLHAQPEVEEGSPACGEPPKRPSAACGRPQAPEEGLFPPVAPRCPNPKPTTLPGRLTAPGCRDQAAAVRNIGVYWVALGYSLRSCQTLRLFI